MASTGGVKALAIASLLLLASSAVAQVAPREWPRTDSFRILMGVGDTQPTSWNGKIRVENGKLAGIEGVCPERTGRIDEPNGSWVLRSHADHLSVNSNTAPVHENGIIVSIAGGTPQTRVAVETTQGTFAFSFQDQPWGVRRAYLKDRVVVERVPAAFRLTTSADDEYAPAMTHTGDNVWVAYIAYTHASAASPGGDRVWLAHYSKARRVWDAPQAVSPAGERCQRIAVSMDARGHVWVFWSANRGNNTDIYARRWSGRKFEPELRLTTAAGPDLNPVATTDTNGRVWVAWQGWRDGRFIILASVQDVDRFLPEHRVSATGGNNWHPAINAGASGEMAFAWDTYEDSNYDVWLRRGWFVDGAIVVRAPVPVATSPRFEARPSMVHDSQNWIWIAYEVAPPRWGKEFGPYLTTGTPLMAGRNVEVRSFKDNMPFVTYDDLGRVLPGPAVTGNNSPPPFPDPTLARRRVPGQMPELPPLPCNAYPRLSADQAGHIFLAYRATSGWHSPAGIVWTEYLHYFNGVRWSNPIAVPHSDGSMESQPAMLPIGYSTLLLIDSSDHRQSAARADAVQGDIYAAEMEIPFRADTAIMNSAPVASRAPRPQLEYDREQSRLRLRAAQTKADGKTLQLLLGDYHRISDLSPTADDEGSLGDAYRYFLDAAALDWSACCDATHGGREFTWWMEQKFSGFFQMDNGFVSLFGYRYPGAFPQGSRSVLLASPGLAPPAAGNLADSLAKSGGIAIPYETATSHGTGWRSLDARIEPVVEIAEGARQSYEAPGAPRAISAEDAIGGLEEAGFVSQALAGGLRLGFLAGSGPVSTHQAFANVWAEQRTPKGILDAIRARHVYASTAPMLAEVHSAGHFMGDEFGVTGAPELTVKLSGAVPFSQVDILRDGKVVYSARPASADLEFVWKDPAPITGKTSYYYVRAQQADGNLLWTSPMWIDVR